MKFESDQELLRKFLSGTEKLEKAVGSTLGPKGRNFIFSSRKNNNRKPVITKDGVTVAKFFESDDPFEDLAIQVIKQASIETNKNAGDGTTTSTVLACHLVREAIPAIQNGANPIELQRGMQECVDQVLKELDNIAMPLDGVDDIRNIATIAANNDAEIGEIVTEAIHKTGKDGTVVVEKGNNHKIELDFKDGFVFNSGFASNEFINKSGDAEAYFENPYIFVTDHTIEDPEQLKGLLAVVDRDERPFVLIAEEVRGAALANCILNANRGKPIAVLNPPSFGRERKEILKDIAASTGARFISVQNRDKLSQVRLKDMGTCETIRAQRYNTTLYGAKGDPEVIQDRIETIKSLAEQEEDADKGEKLAQRAARLSSSVAVVKSGGSTEAEARERKYRIEDAIEAVKSAQEQNVILGGGMALKNIASDMPEPMFASNDVQTGWQILNQSLVAPFQKIATNSGKHPAEIDARIVSYISRKSGDFTNIGFNFKTGEVSNLKDDGIIDPLKVTKNALINAASAAGILITAKCAAIKEES